MSSDSSNHYGDETFVVEHASISDLGMRRANNQDAVASMICDDKDWRERGHLFMVADGMGAHAAGELASRIAVDNVPHTYQKLRNLQPPAALRQAVHSANEKIHSKGQSAAEFNGMGTTCSCLVLLPGVALVAHVGDSRVYRLRSGHLEQLTFDHSLVWEMAAANEASDVDVPACIPKNVITRSLGPHAIVNVDLEGPHQVIPGDAFLLCSDGLTAVLDDELIGSLVDCLPPEEATATLVDIANLRGGPDNISIVIARVSGAPNDDEVDAPDRDSSVARRNAKTTVWSSLLGWLAGGTTRTTTINNLGGPYGNGPYRLYDCDLKDSSQKLSELTCELVALETAPESPLSGNRSINWELFKQTYARAQDEELAGKYRNAISIYSEGIRQLMSQVRDGENRDTTTDVHAP